MDLVWQVNGIVETKLDGKIQHVQRSWRNSAPGLENPLCEISKSKDFRVCNIFLHTTDRLTRDLAPEKLSFKPRAECPESQEFSHCV